MSNYLENVVCLERTDNSVFFSHPLTLNINEEARTKYASSQKIEILISELKEKGPLLGLGSIGPNFYNDDPFKLSETIHGREIYGWKPGAVRKNARNSYVIILGAKKSQEREFVYFTMSDDVTLNQRSYVREHRPSLSDRKVYVTSHKTFLNFLEDLYPPCEEAKEKPKIYGISSMPSEAPSFSSSETKYVQQLAAIQPLESILDGSDGQRACKAIGQAIFDKYKQEAGGNYKAGQAAAVRICNAIRFFAPDGFLRKQYIDHAWNLIGDENWKWLA